MLEPLESVIDGVEPGVDGSETQLHPMLERLELLIETRLGGGEAQLEVRLGDEIAPATRRPVEQDVGSAHIHQLLEPTAQPDTILIEMMVNEPAFVASRGIARRARSVGRGPPVALR